MTRTIEGFAKLRPVFHAKGTVTAGNSSQMSDGAAATVVMSADKAKEMGLTPMARFVSLCDRRMFAGRNGNRTGLCDSEGVEIGWFNT